MKLLKKFFKPIYTYLMYIFLGAPYALFRVLYENSTEWLESYWYVFTHWNEKEDEIPLINPCGQSLQERVRIDAENARRTFGEPGIMNFIPENHNIQDVPTYYHHLKNMKNPCAEIVFDKYGNVIDNPKYVEFLKKEEMEI